MKLTLKSKKAKDQPVSYNRTKIVTSIGPASYSYEMILELIKAGSDAVSLNFSHGTHEEQLQKIKWARQAAEALDKPIAVIQELQGPKIRVGDLPQPLELKAGQPVRFAHHADYQSSGIIPIQYDFSSKVRPGAPIFLFDGTIKVKVTEVHQGVIHANVEAGGTLSSRKGINLPDTNFEGNILTAKDLDDIRFAASHDVDYVGLSFVQTAKDVRQLRRHLDKLKSNMKVIAKIETKTALEHLEEIIEAADAVMVARGDLAIETAPEIVPIVQRNIIAVAQRKGKISLVATQMLASMVEAPQPTRAEASDVANSVISGADCLMLRDETASGQYPLESVQMMERIIRYTEANLPTKVYIKPEDGTAQTAISAAIITLADQIQATAIVAETLSGGTARSLAAQRPIIPIMMVSNHQRVAQQLAIVYGGRTFYRRGPAANEKITSWLKKQGMLKSGDIVVIAAGKQGVVGGTDTIRVRVTK